MAVPAEVGVNAPPRPLAFMNTAPSRQSDATGGFFAGPEGVLFNSLLAEAGVARDEVVLINRVRCYPPGNRLASAEGQSAMAECAHWVSEELKEYNPLVVVLLGAFAFQELFGATSKATAVRGSVRAHDGRMWVPSWHPNFLRQNRDAGHMREAVEDYKLAMRLREEACTRSYS